jgi:hypothetical protein
LTQFAERDSAAPQRAEADDRSERHLDHPIGRRSARTVQALQAAAGNRAVSALLLRSSSRGADDDKRGGPVLVTGRGRLGASTFDPPPDMLTGQRHGVQFVAPVVHRHTAPTAPVVQRDDDATAPLATAAGQPAATTPPALATAAGQPTPAAAPGSAADTPSAAGPTAPQLDRTLLAARAVLNQTERASNSTRQQVSSGLAALPVFDLIGRRDRARGRLETLTGQLLEARSSAARRAGAEHGVPLTQGDQQRVATEIDALRIETTQLQAQIGRSCAVLQVSEEQIAGRVEGIAYAVEHRGIQIAIGQLEHNARLASSERNRLLGGSMAALRRVAIELDTERIRISNLRAAARRSTYDLPSAGIGADNAGAVAFAQQAADQGEEASRQLDQRTAAAVLAFPVLAHIPPSVIAQTPEGDQLNALVGDRLSRVITDIRDTRTAVNEHTISVWDLPQIVELAWQDLGLPEDPVLRRVARGYVARHEVDAEQRRMIRTAFEITATLLASVAGPGVGALVGAAFAGVRIAESTSRFLGQVAAVDATMDPRIQGLTRTYPELIPILEDIAGLVPNAGQLLSGLRALVTPLRLLQTEARIAQFAAAAERALPSAAATRVVEGVLVQQLRTPSALNRLIAAMPGRVRFHEGDLEEMERMLLQVFDQHPTLITIAPNLHRVEQPGFGRLLNSLRQDDRIRPLTRQALIDHDPLLSPERLSYFLQPQFQGWQIDGTVFIREGHAQDCMRTIVHEAVHINQRLAASTSRTARAPGFPREMQAFTMERDFVERLAAYVGEANLSPDNRWILRRSDRQLAEFISGHPDYPGHDVPFRTMVAIVNGEAVGYDEVVAAMLEAEHNAYNGRFRPLGLASLTGATP